MFRTRQNEGRHLAVFCGRCGCRCRQAKSEGDRLVILSLFGQDYKLSLDFAMATLCLPNDNALF